MKSETPERPMAREYEFLEDGATCRLSTEGPKEFAVSIPVEFDDNLREGALAAELLRVVAERDEARARIRSLTSWLPMEDAPRDGTRILVDFGSHGVHAVAWEESVQGTETWCVDDQKHGPYALRGYQLEDIKGWKYLPAQPVPGSPKEVSSGR